MANLLDHFQTAVDRNPDVVAIIDGKGQETTFLELQSRIKRIAAFWKRKGIKKGDRVLLAMAVDADLYASLAALWTLGATVVLPEPAMGLKGLRHAAQTTKPKAFCAKGAYVALRYLLPELWGLTVLRPKEAGQDVKPAIVDGTNTALISFTSGTTGRPKAIPRSHAFLVAQHDAIAPLLDSTQPERDLVAFPVFTLINLAAGRTSVLPNWKMSKLGDLAPQQLADWIDNKTVSRLLVPPSLCEKLVKSEMPDSLHTVFTGGGPVYPDLARQLENKVSLVCVYGSTEAEPIAHLSSADISVVDHDRMKNGHGLLVGKPVPQIRLRIVEDEVQVAGNHVNDRYLDVTHMKGNKVIEGDVVWHRTGDAGRLEDDGRLWLLGRVGSEVTGPKGRLYPFAIEVAARNWNGVIVSALIEQSGQAVLCVQGDKSYLETWQQNALNFGVDKVIGVDKIPMDRRHHSKVDRNALTKQIGNPS